MDVIKSFLVLEKYLDQKIQVFFNPIVDKVDEQVPIYIT